jgi:uncharacterized protein YpuA (DUF1002 family)
MNNNTENKGIQNFGGSINAENIAVGENATIEINRLKDLKSTEAPKVAELLDKLKVAIETNSNLSQKDKNKALKQVKDLAEAAQNLKDEENQNLADNAITMLKGIFAGLPAMATLVEEGNKLLPVIAKLFGL